jgi:hypothetical protein
MYIYPMVHIHKRAITSILLGTFLMLAGCHNPSIDVKNAAFQVLDDHRTGLDFSNTLHPTAGFNLFNYMYYYNGGGVGAGDFNNDGRIDLFFAANQGENKLYLNDGNLKFTDVTKKANIPNDSAWSTGISVVDINNDGLLDLYVCRVGHLNGLPNAHNQLLVCQGISKEGIPTYKDEAKEYGLDFSGFSTQAAFFDYDGDGDLDMYLLNHTLHQNGTYGPRQEKLTATNPYSGDRLFRNDGNNKFTDVTAASGIHSSVLGYGLGITVADINLDGSPDIYVGNDFHENDYLYINQKNGTFKDELETRIMHTSRFSMGVDVADADNDGWPEIISMDMLAYDPYILRRSEGEDSWDGYNIKLNYGYNYQYTRNNLQYNRRNGRFSEIGLYSGVAATDWSWSPLWVDFDNDGSKDLFISNGIPKRLNDIDFINFVTNQQIVDKVQNDNNGPPQEIKMIEKFPTIKLPSKFFRNAGAMQFTDLGDSIAGTHPAYSNGAIAADLDNDGDLDILVNCIDQPVMLYRNTCNDASKKDWLDLKLKGSPQNINAIGARLILFTGKSIRTYEKFPVHGFLSSAETPIHLGLDHTHIDSLLLIWPDNTVQHIDRKPGDTSMTVKWQPGLPHFDYTELTNYWKNTTRPVKDITTATGLLHKHIENSFHEFDREPLIPHMLSTEGPALAIGDFNKDGLEDAYIGGSKREKRALFIQDRAGRFHLSPQPALEKDSMYEDIDAGFIDVNQDGHMDLVVASGGNEFYGHDTLLSPRVYLGDGKGRLTKKENAFDSLFVNASCIAPADFNGDGHPDLFIGGRSVPFHYGDLPRSYLLLNDGAGRFKDVTNQIPGLSTIGFVTSALWFDLDKDGKKDLLLTLEWGGIIAFLNKGASFTKIILTDKKGWWNFILPVDLDGDGNIDLVAGNLGLNSRLKATADQPVRMYYSDFDGNGTKEQLLTYYLHGKEFPFANKAELEKQLPELKKKFLYAEDFAKAGLSDLLSPDQLKKADTLTANYFANAILMGDGHLHFDVKPLPWEAQLSPYRDAAIVDANGDNLPDILVMGNYYENNIQMGRYDADYGTVLVNKGHGAFDPTPLNGLTIPGQVRHIRPITIGNKPSLLLVRNNDSTRIIHFEK